MKNNMLDLNRLWLSLRKDLLENKKALLQEVLYLSAILLGIIVIMGLGGRISADSQRSVFEFGFVVLGLLVADKSFSATKNKVQGMFYLMTPESTLERFITALAKTFIFFPIAYCVVFFVVDFFMFGVMSGISLVHMDIFQFGNSLTLDGIRAMLLFQSIYILGSIWFEKRSFLKTTASILLYFIALILVLTFVVAPIVSDMKDTYEGSYVFSTNFSLDLMSPNLHVWSELLQWLLIPFFWIVTYFRISEKQI